MIIMHNVALAAIAVTGFLCAITLVFYFLNELIQGIRRKNLDKVIPSIIFLILISLGIFFFLPDFISGLIHSGGHSFLLFAK
jgi:uncharacterized protein with PQ loop repeat